MGLAKSEMTHSPLPPAISPLSSTRQQVAASVALASNALSCTLYTVSVDTAHKTPQTASNKQALQPTDRTQNYLDWVQGMVQQHKVYTVCTVWRGEWGEEVQVQLHTKRLYPIRGMRTDDRGMMEDDKGIRGCKIAKVSNPAFLQLHPPQLRNRFRSPVNCSTQVSSVHICSK